MKKDFDKFYNNLEKKRKLASEELDNKNNKQAKKVIIIIMAFGIITSIFTDFTVLVVCIILSVVVHLKVTNGLDRKDLIT